MVTVATHVYETGFGAVIDNVKDRGVTYLMQFPFLGPATSYHLAKNIGLHVAKPNPHLIRIADALGYRISNWTRRRVAFAYASCGGRVGRVLGLAETCAASVSHRSLPAVIILSLLAITELNLNQAGRRDHTIKVYPNGSHNLMEVPPDNPNESVRLKRFPPGFFEMMVDWTTTQLRQRARARR